MALTILKGKEESKFISKRKAKYWEKPDEFFNLHTHIINSFTDESYIL